MCNERGDLFLCEREKKKGKRTLSSANLAIMYRYLRQTTAHLCPHGEKEQGSSFNGIGEKEASAIVTKCDDVTYPTTPLSLIIITTCCLIGEALSL